MYTRDRIRFSTCLVILALAGVGNDAHADVNWIGGDGDWSSSTSWSSGVLPTLDDFVTLPSGVVVTAASGASQLAKELNNSADVRLSGALEVVGTIDNFGPFEHSAGTVAAGRIINREFATYRMHGATTSATIVEGLFNYSRVDIDTAAAIAAESFDNFDSWRIGDGARLSTNSGINHAAATLTVSGNNTALNVNGNLTNDGTLALESGTSASLTSIVNTGSNTITSSALNLVSGLIETSGSMSLSGAASELNVSAGLINAGTLSISAAATTDIMIFENRGAAQFSQTANVTAGGVSNASSATLEVTHAVLLVGENFVNAGTVVVTDADISSAAYLQDGGTTALDNARLAGLSTGINVQGGRLSGSGALDGTTLIGGAAEIAAGTTLDPTGLFEIDDELELSGLAEFDIAGVAADAFDRFAVTGSTTLGGTLAVTLLDGYAPANGDFYDIITATTVTGAFDALVFPTFDGRTFAIEYGNTYTRLLVKPVPVPASLVLFISAVVALGRWRR